LSNTRAWRWLLVLLHRYVGLSIAGFLVIVSLTGAILTFEPELDAALNPELFAAPHRNQPRLHLDELIVRVERADLRLDVRAALLPQRADESVMMRVVARDGASPLSFDQVFVDPATGAMLGRRLWGECCFTRPQLIPALYRLHMSLFIPGRAGTLLMGGVALAWLFDSFVGLALAWPRGKRPRRAWLQALTFKRGAKRFRALFDLHRLLGLWPWPLLIMSAVTSISLNLRHEVFEPVVELFSPLKPNVFEEPARPTMPSKLSFDDAGIRALKGASSAFVAPSVVYIQHVPDLGVYSVGIAERGGNARNGLGPSWYYIDHASGAIRDRNVIGAGSNGDVFLQAQLPLHNGRIAGDIGRILMAFFGIAVAGLSLSGVYLWWRKRLARSLHHRRSQSRAG
jgi:uncharacterized iron-regulated membrane protein